MQVVGRIEPVEHHRDRPVRQRRHRQAHRVDRAEAGVGDEHDQVGRTAVDEVACRRRARSASGRRRPSRPGRRRRRPATRSSATRSSRVNGRRPRTSAAIGRRHRHRVPAVRRADGLWAARRWRAPAASASVSLRSSPGSKDCAGLRADHGQARGAQRSRQPARHPRLADLGAGAGDDDQRSGRLARTSGMPSASSASTSRSTCSAVWAADSATRRRDVPGGHRRRADGRHEQALVAAARRRRPAPRSSSPSTTGTIGDGCPGRSRSTCARRRATSASPSADRTTRSAASAAAASAGVDAVVKMNGRARLTQQVDDRAGPGDEAAERAQRLRQRADPQHGTPRASAACGSTRARARRGPRRARAARRGRRTRRRGPARRRRRRPSRTPCRSRPSPGPAGRRDATSSSPRWSRSPWR